MSQKIRSKIGLCLCGLSLVLVLSVGLPAVAGGQTTDTTDTGNVSVTTLATGQSLAQVVETPTQTLVYDTGGYRDDGSQIIEYLQQENISTVDHLVVSHADSDHAGGAEGIIDHLENQTANGGVGTVWDGGTTSSTATWTEYRDTVLANNLTWNNQTRAGDSIPTTTPGFNVTVLNPPVGETPVDSRPNDFSVSLLLDYEDIEWVLAGDLSKDYEQKVYTTFDLSRLNVESLSVGHHGADTSTSDTWLQVLEPAVATISAPNSSTYNHPEPAVLSRLATVGETPIDTFWTGKHGSIVETSNGENLTVRTQFERPENATELRDSPTQNTSVSPWTLDIVTTQAGLMAQGTEPAPVIAPGEETSDNGVSNPVIIGIFGAVLGGIGVAARRSRN